MGQAHDAADPRAGPGRRIPGGHERRQHLDRAVAAARSARAGEPPPGGPGWGAGPAACCWMLGIVAWRWPSAAYPIIRRLTQRLDDLRDGRRALGRRRPVACASTSPARTKLAFLAQRFNHAAERVEALLQVAQVAAGQCVARAALAAGAHPHGAGADGAAAVAGVRSDEIRATSRELDQLIDEILLASRLDAQRNRHRHRRGGGPHGPGRRGMRARGRRAGARPTMAAASWWCRAWPSCCGAPCATCWRTPGATATAR